MKKDKTDWIYCKPDTTLSGFNSELKTCFLSCIRDKSLIVYSIFVQALSHYKTYLFRMFFNRVIWYY